MNNYEKCRKRDKAIFDLLESQVCMTTEMLHILIFKGNCLRVVQDRLAKLSNPPYAKINRDRIRFEPYFYYMGSKPRQLDHVLGVSWVYCWITSNLSNMERIHCFDRELKDFKQIRPDAFVAVKNLWKDSFSFAFIELDIGRSGNDFAKKVKKYNDLFQSETYSKMWWVEHTRRFPKIIVVTTGRVKSLLLKIESENVNNLEFQVYSLGSIKEECLKWVKPQNKSLVPVPQGS